MKKSQRFNFLLIIVKLTVFLACLYIGVVYLKDNEPNWNKLTVQGQNWLLLPVIVVLACLNWLIESVKWRNLIHIIDNITLVKAIKATLSGMAVSFVTPFRVGDFAGKVSHLKQNRRKATILTFYGNYTQLTTTFLFGIIAASSMVWYNPTGLSDQLLPILLVIGWGLTTIIVFMVFRPGALLKLIRLADFDIIESTLGRINHAIAIRTFMYSITRYIIFILQYYLCFEFFSTQLNFTQLVPLISLMYLFITFVPSPVLGKLGVRESVSLYLIGPLENTAVILTASLLIWFVNLFIPSIIGSYYLLRTKQRSGE